MSLADQFAEYIERAAPWRADAACVGAPSDWFFPVDPETRMPGYALCARCPVRTECLTQGLEDRVVGYDEDGPGRRLSGIWGGTSEQERREMRRG